MTVTADKEKLLRLPRDERLQLIEDLWDSLTLEVQSSLTDYQRAELDKRIDALEGGTSIGEPWDKVRSRLL
jgi:putative addiction module component (TIGR02574 family)